MSAQQRARHPDQREARRRAILDAARTLFAEVGYAELRMAELAARADLAKGTLYLYFPTKEALFLSLLEEAFSAWFDGLDARLDAAGPLDAAAAAALLTEQTVQAQLLRRLLPLLHSILEHNIPAEQARHFKGLLLERTLRSGERLERRVAGLQVGQGSWLLLRLNALTLGLAAMTTPAPVVAEVMRAPAFAPLALDFAPALTETLTALIRGLAPQEAP